MKKNKSNTKFDKQQFSTPAVESFSKEVSKLMREGYVAMPKSTVFERENKEVTWGHVLNTYLSPRELNGKPSPGEVFSSTAHEIQITHGIGTEGLGFMGWGMNNDVPNRVALLSSLLPYTAQGNRFNTDVAAGLGPRPKYRYTIINNGKATVEEIDYKDAGKVIKARIQEKQKELINLSKESREAGVNLHRKPMKAEAISSEEWSVYNDMKEFLLSEKGKLEEEYEVWERTNAEVEKFMTESNLPAVFLALYEDMVLFDICYPEIRLSQGSKSDDGKTWNPKITSLGYYETITCRKERMDDKNVVNYVYVSNSFYDNSVKDFGYDDIMAIPALDPLRPLPSLKEKIRDARLGATFKRKIGEQGKVQKSSKPTRFILPSYYPAVGRPYYPQPAWWSIFGGSIYQFAANIIADRVKAKENSTMWGKVIYVHTQYLEQLYVLKNATTNEQMAAVRDEMWEEVSQFLKDRSGNGSTLLSFTFTGYDGKDHDAYKIVDVPTASKSETEAQKTELQEISSILFFTMGVHPELLGAAPGRSGSSGGTFQREMYLLKTLNMKPTQMIPLKVFDVISKFNDWDYHLIWKIQEHVLSTLDRSKTGITESEN